MPTKQFISRIQALPKLTSKEKLIADFFARNYDELVFENLTSISEKAGVSKPTVLRFINKLGFEKFAQFNAALKSELTLTHDSLHIRYSLKKKLMTDSQDDVVAAAFNHTIKNLETTYARLDKSSFSDMAKRIGRCRGKRYFFGQRSSHALAYLFFNMVRRVLSNTIMIPTGCGAEPDNLVDVCGDDLLFMVFRHPYGAEAFRLASYFADQGAQVLLLTDSELNPAAKSASCQLVVNTEGVSVYTSSTGILTVIEALNEAVLGYCDADVSGRLGVSEELYRRFGTFYTR